MAGQPEDTGHIQPAMDMHGSIPPGLQDYRYEARPIRFLGVRRASAWQVKRYAITTPGGGGRLPEEAAAAAWDALASTLPADLAAGRSQGAAILTMHAGRQGFWVLVDWWAFGDILMHRHFRAAADRPVDLRDVSGEGFGPCVWELAVQAHERHAWLEHVLANPAGPDLSAYLLDGLSAEL